jgi:hypothetical protein
LSFEIGERRDCLLDDDTDGEETADAQSGYYFRKLWRRKLIKVQGDETIDPFHSDAKCDSLEEDSATFPHFSNDAWADNGTLIPDSSSAQDDRAESPDARYSTGKHPGAIN